MPQVGARALTAGGRQGPEWTQHPVGGATTRVGAGLSLGCRLPVTTKSGVRTCPVGHSASGAAGEAAATTCEAAARRAGGPSHLPAPSGAVAAEPTGGFAEHFLFTPADTREPHRAGFGGALSM